MISPLRLTTAGCLSRCSRAMSTSIRDQSTVKEAYSAIGMGVSATLPQLSSSPSPSTMNIPLPEDPLLQYLTSRFVLNGKRARASRIVSQTLLHIHAYTRAPPLPILRQAILDAAPAVRTLMNRRGGKTVPKPIALSEQQRVRFAVEEILNVCKYRRERTIEEKLAKELIAILQGKSKVLETKENIHKFAMVNRGNAQTRI